MQLTPLLISILLLVTSKLKPLEPSYQKITNSLISLHQPITSLKNKTNQQKILLTSLPKIRYQNLDLQAENSQLKTQNLLLKNKLNLTNFETPSWNTVPVRIIKIDQVISATSNQTDQVKPGMPLVHSTNIIGIVQKVSSSIIYILPLKNDDISFPVQTDQDTQGDYVFQNRLSQMTNITDQETPNQDDTVFTLPTEEIPEGLIVGQVKQVLTKPSNPIQKVEIDLPLNVSQITDTYIITDPN
jgi:cell shape-determining protein MreC